VIHLRVQKVFLGHDVDALPDDETFFRLLPPFLDV
jgi:hypothetical protein